MFDRIAQWQPDQGAAVAARAVAALALAALAVIHVVDLPGTLGPTPLVGIGYLGIIAAAVLIGGVLIARPHWLAWAAAAAVAARRWAASDPRPAAPGRSRRCRELALPAGHRRAQRGIGDHPARPARRGQRLAGADPRRERGRGACRPRGARPSTADPGCMALALAPAPGDQVRAVAWAPTTTASEPPFSTIRISR